MNVETNYVCKSVNGKKSEVSGGIVIDKALDIIKENGNLHFSYGEMTSAYYFFDEFEEKTYTVDNDFIDKLKFVAKKSGIIVEGKEEYSNRCLIGEDYGLTGYNISIVAKYCTAIPVRFF